MSYMDIRHFRSFVTIADLGNITHAAQKLGIEQAPLSQQLRKMEESLGTPLFIRQTRGVILTEAGRILLPRARLILDLRRQFVETAHAITNGEQGHLRIGLAGAVPLLPAIPNIIRDFRNIAPGITLSLEESNTPALCDSLLAYRIDIAVLRPPVTHPDRIRVIPLFNEPTLIALPTGHRFACKKSIHLKQLTEDRLIIFPRELGPGFYDAIIAAFQNAGSTPPLGQQAPQITGIIPLVAAGLGFSIVPRSLQQLYTSDVTYHEIVPPAPYATLAIGLRDDIPPPPVERFITMLKTIEQTG